MSKNSKGCDNHDSTVNTTDQSSDVSNDRRGVMKKTLTIGGITVVGATWKTPVVESVVLPAHGQTTTERFVAVINI